jgi:hypothetical protein
MLLFSTSHVIYSLDVVLCTNRFDPVVCLFGGFLKGFNPIASPPDEVPCLKEFEPILVCPVDE